LEKRAVLESVTSKGGVMSGRKVTFVKYEAVENVIQRFLVPRLVKDALSRISDEDKEDFIEREDGSFVAHDIDTETMLDDLIRMLNSHELMQININTLADLNPISKRAALDILDRELK
jgi:hypothetical protein